MAKITCSVCGNDVKKGNIAVQYGDAAICNDCKDKAAISRFSNGQSFSQEGLIEYVRNRLDYPQIFTTTRLFEHQIKKKITTKFEIDDEHKLFRVGRDIFEFDKLVGYEVISDGDVIQKGGVGRAVVGGLLFGGAGAVVGAATRSSKKACSTFYVQLKVKDTHYLDVRVNLIAEPVGYNSWDHQQANEASLRLCSMLQSIIDENEAALQDVMIEDKSSVSFSPSEEIMKLKEMHDAGILTDEEFSAAKAKLLDRL